MGNMKEVLPELDLIDIRQTSLICADEIITGDSTPIRRKNNRMIHGIDIFAAVSLAINVIQSVIIYVLQAGPI